MLGTGALATLLLEGRAVTLRPSESELHRLAATAPSARLTRYGSVNVRTRATTRGRRSTFYVGDAPAPLTGSTLSPAEADRFARAQDEYLGMAGVIVVDGYLGAPGPVRMAVRIIVERSAAPIAAMQRHLLFDPVVGRVDFAPELTVVSTPGLTVAGAPDGCLIAVWPGGSVTRIAGTDFFGETKKAATRMWAEHVFNAGGLVLHAACVVVPSPQGPRTVVVVGPPDSGKSTLAIDTAIGCRLIQDDFVALLPGGQVVPAENGCVEKTRGLQRRPDSPLYTAATRPDTYLENVVQRGRHVHFSAVEAPPHARAVFPLRTIAGDATAPIAPIGLLVVLDPGEDLAPALARLDSGQAPGHFLLRERRQGLAEPTGRQGNRLAELLATCSAEVVVINTAAHRCAPGIERGRLTAALVTALAAGDITWQRDDDLRTAVAQHVSGVDDLELLWPRQQYERLGLLPEYAERAAAIRAERRAYLSRFVGLDSTTVAAVS
jgi:phosphoenolpyruvate carboxykinase (ATP)